MRTLFIAAQICSVQPKIEAAITNSLRLYARAVRTTAIPIGLNGPAAKINFSALICTETLKIFQYPGFSSDIAARTISNTLINNWEAYGLQVAGQALGAMGMFGFPGVAMWAGAAAVNTMAIPQFGRLLLMCTVDVIIIMERVYWKAEGRTTPENVEDACAWYKEKVDAVHKDVKPLLPVMSGIWGAFQYDKLKIGLEKIIEKHRFGKGKQL